MDKTIIQISKFVISVKGYYLFPKEFKDKSELEDLVQQFYHNFSYYQNEIKIIILPCSHNNSYKLFFISTYSYNTIVNIIQSTIEYLKNKLNNNIHYISKILELEYLPIIFIQLLLDTLNVSNDNFQLIYKNKQLQLILYNL